MPRSKLMLSGLLALGVVAELAGPALAGDFDVSTSNSTVHHAPPPPPPPPRPDPAADVAAVRG